MIRVLAFFGALLLGGLIALGVEYVMPLPAGIGTFLAILLALGIYDLLKRWLHA